MVHGMLTLTISITKVLTSFRSLTLCSVLIAYFIFHTDWLHNEIKLTTLCKQNESIMKSFLSLSQNLADIQRELQLFLDRSSRSKSIPVNQQIESVGKCLNEVTQTRQKCIREIRECIRLSEDLVYREKQRWNFIHKLSDAQV